VTLPGLTQRGGVRGGRRDSKVGSQKSEGQRSVLGSERQFINFNMVAESLISDFRLPAADFCYLPPP